MNAERRIGLIMPEITDPLDYELIEGVFSQAKRLGYDVIIYTGIFNSQSEFQQDYHTAGLENIYTLACQNRLDGILYAAERFRNPELIERIFQEISQTVTPCLSLGAVHEGFTHMNAAQHDSVYEVTQHLIQEHGCRRLHCIAGLKGHESSEERLQGFLDAMKDAGLTVTDEDITYGGYWHQAPKELAQRIADGLIPRPDGVVALSDSMALPFCKTLMKNGIRIPEDIAVTGYDGSWFALMAHPQLTTVSGRDAQFGADAVCRLHYMITGCECTSAQNMQQLRIGRSCGCGYDKIADLNGIVPALERLAVRHLTRTADRTFIATDLINRLAGAATLDELMASADRVGHILPGWKWIDLCLCEDWTHDFDNPDQFRQHGFSNRIHLALSKRYGVNENSCTFPCTDTLPALSRPHEPCIIVMTSLHCKGQIFGYCATMYENADDIDLGQQYVSWTEAVANGLHLLQKRLYMNHVHQQMEAFSTIDAITGLLNKRGLTEQLPDQLHQLRKQHRCYEALLISWVEDSAVSAFDLTALLANALKSASGAALLARFSDNIFACLLTGDNTSSLAEMKEESIVRIESELRKHIPEQLPLPQLITESFPLNGKTPAELERSLQQILVSFDEKKSITQSYYTTQKETLFRLRREILAQPQLEWNIPDISKKLGISRSHLHRLYREFFASSIKDEIINARMSKAMHLLAHTDFKVQEIAEHCGYHNENHFMRQFKEKTGMTALQYRKNYV